MRCLTNHQYIHTEVTMAEEEAKEIKPGMTFEQVKTMIIGSEEKSILLNIFTGLMNENSQLKRELDQLKSDKSKQ